MRLRYLEDMVAALVKQGGAEVEVLRHDGTSVVGTLQQVQREDGSGVSFNLTVQLKCGHMKTVYWRACTGVR